MHYVMYRDKQGYWRWRFMADNNRILADSGEGYVNKADCKHAIALIATSGETKVHEL